MESIDFVNLVLIVGSLLVLVGIFSSLIAQRFGAPLLLIFLLVGMLAGEDGPVGLVFNDYQAAYLIGSLALAIILFDGGLRTRAAAFRSAFGPSVTLASLGVILTAVLLSVPAMLIFGLSPVQALLMGAIVASTDAAAVFFLLRARGLQLRSKVGSTLEIESATNDPIAVLLTLLFVQLAGISSAPLADMSMIFLQQAFYGASLGILGGFGAVALLNRVDLPGGLHPLLVVALAVLIFSLTAYLGGSGFLAVFLAGLIVGNRPVRAFPSIRKFHDAMTWFSQIVMFIVLGLLATPSTLIVYAPGAILFALALIFVVRPIAVAMCLFPFRFSFSEQAFISWVGLRGAVSIFLASIPMMMQKPEAELYFNVAFFVVLVSLVVQGSSIRQAAKLLRVAKVRRLPSVNRIDLDLPGQNAYELAGYAVGRDSEILSRRTLPHFCKLALVVREGSILRAHEVEGVKAGDYAYFVVPPEHAHRLDRLFIDSETLSVGRRHIFQKVRVSADMPIQQIKAAHGLRFGSSHRRKTIGEVFAARMAEARAEGNGTQANGKAVKLPGCVVLVADTEAGAPRSFDLFIDMNTVQKERSLRETIEEVLRELFKR